MLFTALLVTYSYAKMLAQTMWLSSKLKKETNFSVDKYIDL